MLEGFPNILIGSACMKQNFQKCLQNFKWLLSSGSCSAWSVGNIILIITIHILQNKLKYLMIIL